MPAKSDIIDVLDQLGNEIHAARALELAIVGQGSLDGFDADPLAYMARALAERLEDIRDRLEE